LKRRVDLKQIKEKGERKEKKESKYTSLYGLIKLKRRTKQFMFIKVSKK
jgi:hypothetical protein